MVNRPKMYVRILIAFFGLNLHYMTIISVYKDAASISS